MALPAGSGAETILEVTTSASRADIEAAFRSKAKEAHPDCGGSHEQMQTLLEAKQQMLSRLKA